MLLQMILWAAIGTLVGIVLGLTGAGGAILAVPIFVEMGFPLGDAMVCSLFTVVVSALLSGWSQRKLTDWVLALAIAAGSIPGTPIGVFIKSQSTTGVLQASFTAFVLFGLFNLWRQKKASAASAPERSLGARAGIGLATGVALGILTPLTGLGGGVVLVPWLSGPLRLSLSRAVATSLGSVAFTASYALWLQRSALENRMGWVEITGLVAGSAIGTLVTRELSRRVAPARLDQVRRWVLTAVIALAVAGVFFRA